MPGPARQQPVSAPLAGLAAWLVPGGGYWLLGQRSRALAIGITIIILFVLGLLIGGVRVLEVPGFGRDGHAIRYDMRGNRIPFDDRRYAEATSALLLRPIDEIRSKPWAIAQVLTGPLSLVGAGGSVWASERLDPPDGGDPEPRGALSHSRINEIGVLYTAVAGMLNLLAIIDSSHRAGQMETK